MSYMRPQRHGNLFSGNGMSNGSSNQINRFEFEDSSRETSADERSRSRGPPEGYGGYGGPRQGDRLYGSARGGHMQRRSRGENDWDDRNRLRAGGGRYGQSGGQVEDILRYIEQQWSFMSTDSCIPVKVALQLMDPSSLGLADQMDQFKDAHTQLQNALKVIVNEHHQGFNSSIGTFHKIQASIHASQLRVRTMRAGLVQAKSSLASTRPELKVFAASSQSYDSMLQVLEIIEQLQQVPERLEAQISEKRFLGAVETLQDALKLIRKPELEDIGALSDLKVYLSNQEHSLTDILIEELHNHLYLKSPYCEERWKAHMQRASSAVAFDDVDRAMHQFLETYNGEKPLQEDTTRNPEADTFYYIMLIIESLNKMGRLEAVVDAIEHRLPVELFTVVERSHMEVQQRHPVLLRTAAATANKKATSNTGLDTEHRAVLEDMLITLFAKYEAIAEGHRVLYDVTAAIIKRDGVEEEEGKTLNKSFRELWKLLQSEIRSLLHDHLASSGDTGYRARQRNDYVGNIFRPQPRDKSRKLFKLSDTDSKSTELTMEREDLEFILKASVPGLVVTGAQKERQDSEAVTDVSATGHKLLVTPSVFNMGALLKPSLAFLHRLREVVPAGSGVVPGTLTSFLDDFLVNIFYPQLEETLVDMCARIMTEIDAFQVDPKWQLHAKRPIFRGVVRFFDLIEAFSVLLDDLPHDQTFSQLIITQMRAYYDRCFSWSKNLLQRAQLAQEGTLKMRLAADLATKGSANDAVFEMMNAKFEAAGALAQKEAALLLNVVKNRVLEEADLINDRKALAALCTLQVSMKWLASRCQGLRYLSPLATDSNAGTQQTRRWASLMSAPSSALTPSHPYLPLDQPTAATFDAVIASFHEVCSLITRTLHIDLRLHILHGIYAALDTTYALNQPYNDPDPAILVLSTGLTSYDAAIVDNLLPPQYAFLTGHLDVLANRALVSLVSSIQALDEFGCGRMQLNVVVLQQSLKTAMQRDASLDYAAKFYVLAEQGPEAIVAEASKSTYAKEDLKALLRLCWDADRDGVRGGLDDWVKRLG